ncbi:hypothetical protein CHUAL_013821 [Chamberlinius hualienensis]
MPAVGGTHRPPPFALEISQSELFDLKSRLDEDSHAKSDEMEIIVTDMERANQRASLAEKEVDHLKEQLSAAHRSLQLADQIQKAPDMEQAISILTRSSLEMELAAKDKEICQLMNDVQQLQTAINQLKESSASQIAQLEEQLELKSKKIYKLEAKLSIQEDYEELKRELEILKSMELGDDERDKPLGVQMANKPTTLHCENISLKMSNAELQGPSVPPDPGPAGPGPGSGQDLTGTTSSASTTSTTATTTLPFLSPSLQTVETFGSLLGEEIVASWQRSEDVPSPPPQDSPSPAPNQRGDNNNDPSTHSELKHLSNGSTGGAGTPLPPPPPVPGSPPVHVIVKETVLERAALDKLQELLRQNIEKHANDSLNTMNISRRVRELLSIHNIGQRLFAKYILGLSQGTVSELLSKPKPWDKLTEKGRDSYRKMHAWASDDSCVMVLKSLVPRKGKHCSPPSHLIDSGGMAYGHFDSSMEYSSGKEPGLPSYRADDMATEERIAMILNEAQQVMKSGVTSLDSPAAHHHHQQFDDRSSNDSETSKRDSPLSNMGLSIKEQCGAAMAAAAMAAAVGGRRVRKYENDDIPQEMVVKIYQEELTKLMGGNMEDGGNAAAAAAAAAALVGIPFSKDHYQRTQEEIRLALNVYHQELSRLTAQQMQVENGVQDLSMPKGDRQKDQRRPNITNDLTSAHLVNGGCSDGSYDREGARTPLKRSAQGSPVLHHSKPDANRHSGSAFTLVRPKTEAAEDVSNSVCGAAVSPLQRMQSITNSLISQPPLPNIPSLPQRPLRAVLPPITQQQFDQYTNLNTEDIVKRVKEQLSQFSISQRLFGENVLGLSQGSVSDLLARPKPWHMLTQKGREPFIRMKIFLEDENAVHKLVASQYKIAPEKLMRTGSGYGVSPPQTASSSKHSQAIKEMEQHKHSSGNFSNSHHIHHSGMGNVHSHHQQQGQHHSSGGVTVHQVHLPNMMSCSSPHDLTRSSTTLTTASSATTPTTVLEVSSTNNRRSSAAAAAAAAVYRAVTHLQPSVYEMAALTQDLDTQTITTKIKETLLANNIGQKIFGEAVLGLSQGSVSELLSKPKPWHMLSIKGREPFIRMQLWLSDPHNVDRLQVLKNERREANKRRRGTLDYLETLEGLDGNSHHHHHQTHLHGSGGGGHHGNGSLVATSPVGPTPKKPRVLFSEEQKEALRIAFTLDPYPSTATIEFLAQELILTPRTITNWFHNHRMRLKQQVPHSLPLPASPRSNNNDDSYGQNNNNNTTNNNNNREGASTFDPAQFRLLLNQRLVEMQKEKGSGGLVNSSATVTPTMTGPYSFYSNSSSPISGLDLSVSSSCHGSLGMRLKREPQDLDNEVESNVSSDYESDNSSKDLGYSSLRLSRQAPTIIPIPQPQLRTPGLPSSRREAELVNAMMGTTVSRSDGNGKGGAGCTSSGGSSSRRKPAAPQWVNPGWDTADDEEEDEDAIEEDDDNDKSDDEFHQDMDREMDDDEMEDEDGLRDVKMREKDEGLIINGVCVRQTTDFRSIRPQEDEDEEAMVVEPAVVHESELRLHPPSSMASSRASSPPSSTSASPPPSTSPSPVDMDNCSSRSPAGTVTAPAHKEVYHGSSNGSNKGRDRLSSIERLERALHEPNENWDDEGRQNNIDKLEQRLLKDEAEEWEF